MLKTVLVFERNDCILGIESVLRPSLLHTSVILTSYISLSLLVSELRCLKARYLSNDLSLYS